MMIVDYLAKIWKALFTATQFFEMAGEERLKEYVSELGKPKEKRSSAMMNSARIAWNSILKSSAPANQVKVDLLSSTIMDQIKTLGLGTPTSVLLMGGNIEKRKEQMSIYHAAVKSILQIAIGQNDYQTQDERNLRDNIRYKLDWVLMDHGDVHFQHPLPLLTPSLIEELALSMNKIENALTEVSDQYYRELH
jgi:hypothetical protein